MRKRFVTSKVISKSSDNESCLPRVIKITKIIVGKFSRQLRNFKSMSKTASKLNVTGIVSIQIRFFRLPCVNI